MDGTYKNWPMGFNLSISCNTFTAITARWYSNEGCVTSQNKNKKRKRENKKYTYKNKNKKINKNKQKQNNIYGCMSITFAQYQ
jgi:hypothetical protein